MKTFLNILYTGLFVFSLLSSRYFSQALFHPTIQVNTIINQKFENPIFTAPPLDKQISLFVFLVDQSKQTKLIGIWWMAIAPQAPITLIPIFPSNKGSTSYPLELIAEFKLIPGEYHSKQLDPSYIENLKILNLPQDGYIVLDLSGLAILVDYLGGIKLNQQAMDGEQVLSHSIDPTVNSKASLEYQTEIWEQLCLKVVFAGSAGNFEIVRPGLTRHTVISPDFPLTFRTFQAHITRQATFACSVNPKGTE